MSSGMTVYNELAATRPDIIHTLTRPNWPFDTYVPRPCSSPAVEDKGGKRR